MEDQSARAIENPHERRGRDRQPAHRAGNDDRDRLGLAQRELLWDQLADDQRQECHKDDDEADEVKGIEEREPGAGAFSKRAFCSSATLEARR